MPALGLKSFLPVIRLTLPLPVTTQNRGEQEQRQAKGGRTARPPFSFLEAFKMKNRVTIIVLAVAVLALASCRNRETSLTGSYGSSVLSGQVVMASEVADSSPAGVEVSVVGTGMSATLAADGRFTFVGVPAEAELTFKRSDGIDARMAVVQSTSALQIELSAQAASPARRRGAPSGQTLQYEGLIRDVAEDHLIVFDSHQQEVTIALTATTKIRRGGTILTAADLKVDDRVHVKALLKDNVLTAVEVMLQNPSDDGDDGGEGQVEQTMTANGPVKSLSGADLVVGSQPRGDVTVKTDASTIIKKQGVRIQVSDIKVGDEINSMGKKVDDHTLLARQIEVRGKTKRN